VFVLAGCGAVATVLSGPPTAPRNADALPPIVQVAEGTGPGGPYRAWIYRTRDGSSCMEVSVGTSGGTSCGPDDASLLGIGANQSNGAILISGGTTASDATSAVARLADGSALPPVRLASGAPLAAGAWFFAIAAGDDETPVGIEIVDDGGAVLETISLRGLVR
jgi:hypothetical protein